MNLPRRPNIDNRLVLVGTIAVLVVALLVCAFLVNLISRGATALVPLTAGLLLLAGNARESLAFWRLRKPSTPLMNSMIGLALIFFGVGSTIFGSNLFRFIFYGPALALLVMALPMAIGRPELYSTYGRWTRTVRDAARSTFGGRRGVAAPPHAGPGAPRETIELDPQDPYGGVTQRDERRTKI